VENGESPLRHSCREFSIAQPSWIQSWVWAKPELSSYGHQSSAQQHARLMEEFSTNASGKGQLQSSKQRPADQGSNASHLIIVSLLIIYSCPQHFPSDSPTYQARLCKYKKNKAQRHDKNFRVVSCTSVTKNPDGRRRGRRMLCC